MEINLLSNGTQEIADYLSTGVQAMGDYLSSGARAMGDYLSTLPEAIETESEKKDGRFFYFDCGDYMLHVAVGILMDLPRLVWVAGDYFPYRMRNEGDGKTVVFLPPHVIKYYKKDVDHLSDTQFKATMIKIGAARFRAELIKARYFREDLFRDLEATIFSDLGDQIDIDEQNMEQEAPPPHTNNINNNNNNNNNIWGMEHLHSSLDNCAMGNCLHCISLGMPRRDTQAAV